MSWRRRSIWIAVGAAAVFAVVRAFQPVPVLVDVATIERGVLRVTVDDDGRTRVRERYTISAPIPGRLLRTALNPGDAVQGQATVVAEFEPTPAELLDARSRAEARATLSRSLAAVRQAQARRAQAEAEVSLTSAALERAQQLRQRDDSSARALDLAERDERLAREGVRAAEFAEQVAQFEVELARASLREAVPADLRQGEADDPEIETVPTRLQLTSPIDGVVLRVFEESARTLAAGAPILEVGAVGKLEVVADFLSQDAVRVRAGMPALIAGWGRSLGDEDEAELRGRVRVVEPGGFTKVSALGVEEQRVNVVIDPADDAPAWRGLGDGYRVEVSVVLSEQADVALVPTGALFRQGADWAVFVVEEGRAALRSVTIGRRNGLQAEVATGLRAGDRVVLYPSDLIANGTRIAARDGGSQ
ncbi:MAG: HlyD family efflux transporter periplasmic adaptor subunit [Planctomycetota bacterium]